MTIAWVRTLAVIGAGVLGGCATTTAPPVATTPAPATTAAVKPAQDCVDLIRIREAIVRDDRTIDFVMTGGETYRNALPYRCPSLGFERAFSYNTSLSKLCSVDIITVIQQGGGPRQGASCGLGKFVPYTPIPAAR